MNATASHIHEGAAGTNGPVIVPFTKSADNTFVAPDGAKLTEAQTIRELQASFTSMSIARRILEVKFERS